MKSCPLFLVSVLSLGVLLSACEPKQEAAEYNFEEFLEGLGGSTRTHWTASEPAGNGAPPVDAEMLANPYASSERWLHYAGDYRGYRHSPIDSLTPESVKDLRVAWGFGPGTQRQFAVSPIVYDGVMYVTTTYNRLIALDAGSGEILWRYDHQLPDNLRYCCGPANRGASIHGDYIFMGTLDAKLLAFDRKTGEVAWEIEVAPYQDGIAITSAPLVLDDRLIVGIGGGEFGVRAFFDAYDVETGERLWRHFTVPKEGEPGVETWAGDSWKRGGAPTWNPGAYDAATDTLYWATGNPGPDFVGSLREGDNLYADSVLAVDARTGERKWHFQFTPHNIWDYDGNTQLFLVDIERDGKPVKAIVQANRNGYFYILDRETGAFLGAEPFAEKLNWATIDATGRPVVSENAQNIDGEHTLVCPGVQGGMNASTTGAFNPRLGLAFVPVIESCATYEIAEPEFVKGLPYLGGLVTFDSDNAYGALSAIDVSNGSVRWRHRDKAGLMGGVLSTAGGTVFTGNLAGEILAFDASSGERVWSFRAGSGIRGQPIAYELDGATYVAVPTGRYPGGEVFMFGDSSVAGSAQLYVFRLEDRSS